MNSYVVLIQTSLGGKEWRRKEIQAPNPQAALHLVLSPQFDEAPDEYIQAEVYEVKYKTSWKLNPSWEKV